MQNLSQLELKLEQYLQGQNLCPDLLRSHLQVYH